MKTIQIKKSAVGKITNAITGGHDIQHAKQLVRPVKLTHCFLVDNQRATNGLELPEWIEKRDNSTGTLMTGANTELAIKLIYDHIMSKYELNSMNRFIYDSFYKNVLWYADCSVGALSQWVEPLGFGIESNMVRFDDHDEFKAAANYLLLLEEYNYTVPRKYHKADANHINPPKWLEERIAGSMIDIETISLEMRESIVEVSEEEGVSPYHIILAMVAREATLQYIGHKTFTSWFNEGNSKAKMKMNWRQVLKYDPTQITKQHVSQIGKGWTGWNPFKAFTRDMIKTGPTPLFRKLFYALTSAPVLFLSTMLSVSDAGVENEGDMLPHSMLWDYDKWVSVMLILDYVTSTAEESAVDWVELGAGDNYRWKLEEAGLNIFKASRRESTPYEEGMDHYFQCYNK
jgi:hypothetical protein